MPPRVGDAMFVDGGSHESCQKHPLPRFRASVLALPFVAIAEEHHGRWVSHPRALIVIVIVVGEGGRGHFRARIELRAFAARANDLDFEIAPGRRMVLRRTGFGREGEYFYPRIGPGDHEHEPYTMLFIRETLANR